MLHTIQNIFKIFYLQNAICAMESMDHVNCDNVLEIPVPGEDGVVVQRIAFNCLVLRNICFHLDYSDVKVFRLVCKFWNHVLTSILYSRSYAILNDSAKLQDFVQNLCDYESAQKLSPEADIIHHGHLTSVKICDINYMEDDLINLEIFWNCSSTDFLNSLEIDLAPHHGNSILAMLLTSRVFPYLNRLKIRILKFYDVKQPRLDLEDNESVLDASSILSPRRCNFPRLKSFSYTYYTFDGSEFPFPIKWEKVLDQCPNIQELYFTGVSPSELHEIMDAIWMLRCTNLSSYKIQRFQVLSEDVLPETPDNTHLTKLSDLCLPLTSLHLEISPSIHGPVLESLLTKYGKSLEELQLRKYPSPVYQVDGQGSEELTDVIFHGLHNLTMLDISDNFLPSLDFLVHLPCLRSLTLSNRNPSKLSETKMIQNTSLTPLSPFWGLRTLNIEENLSTNCFKKICGLFPSLQHLTLRLDDEMLRILYAHLTRLKSLHIISKVTDDEDDDGSGIWSPTKKPTCSDKGITGIPLRFMVWGNVNTQKHRMFPFIGYLQQLEELTIEMWGNYGVGVTNLSIYYGLLELPRLRKVKLIRTLVTEDGVDLLNSKGIRVTVLE